MTDCLCPLPEQLRDVVLGRITDAQFEAIAAHLEDCAQCQQFIEDLEGSTDQLVSQLGRLRQDVDGRSNSNEIWEVAVQSIVSSSSRDRSRISADAGRDLARRLLEGVVKLDRFELRAELGVGSFGYVFQAWDPRLERIVALKVQRAGSLASQEDIERFLREARSVARLKHPSIVSLYETGQTDDGVWFLVCEHVHGITLEERIKQGAIDPQQVANVVGQLAAALQYAHEQGVVHRDIKPSNIILDHQHHAHVMDFGLAKRDASEPTMTSDGRILGTPAYMSPEQASGGSHQVDARSDIYSLGVVMYEMLTGEKPFHGNRRLLLLQVLEDDPRPPRTVKPGVPRDLEVICQKAMNKSPSRRYQSASAMADDLKRYLHGQPILARPMGHTERMLRWCRRYPLAVSALVTVLVGSFAGLLYLSSLSEVFVRQTALESARLETKMLDEVWRFYSDEISDIDPKVTNVAITENYRNVHPALPLPATFAIDLGERISRRHPGMEVRVYSRYPWPSRKDGGPQDENDRIALSWLESIARPTNGVPAEFVQFTPETGHRKLLYYTARYMEKSCLGCHNHPESRSPKKDWKEGDVVGVLKIVRPLDREIGSTQTGLLRAFLIMGAIWSVVLAMSAAVMMLLERRRKGDLS